MNPPAFSHLFSPITVGHKTLKHRLNMGAHTANMSQARLPSARHKGYYLERAMGGAAMIVVEPVPVHRSGVFKRGCFLAESDAIIEPFRDIVDACHAYQTVMVQQLLHIGAHGDYDNSYHANWSPSGFASYHDSDGSHGMSGAQIEEVIDAFVAAALRAQQAHFDGVEIFAAYNALVDQFWSPLTNTRNDEWGGDFTRRMRFSAEILTRIRKACGDRFIIGLAVTGDDLVPGSLDNAAIAAIAGWHDSRRLMDYISVGTGSYFDFSRLIPTFQHADKLGASLAAGVKAAVMHARVQAESHIRTPENADYVIASGDADMVSIVRGQIADPHMANKAQDGRVEDIRPCISCNQMCWGRRGRDYYISCLVNPSAGHEFQWGGDRFHPMENPRKVLVVGGGPAGLEAARVAAERGARVTLAEASDKLGGQFRLAGLQPRRGQILDLVGWYEAQLRNLQVNVLYNAPMDADDVIGFKADAVVLATGSLPADTGFQRALAHVPRLAGLERGNWASVEDIIGGAKRAGEHVLLIDDGGNWRGGGTAWYMAERGHRVTLVTPDAMAARELQRSAADFALHKTFKHLGVETIVHSAIGEWHGDGATLINILDNSTRDIAADTLVLATPNVSVRWLGDALDAWHGRAPQMFQIGDGVAPRGAPAAIYEGRTTALAL